MTRLRSSIRSVAVRDALADQLRAMARSAPDPAAFLSNRQGIRSALEALFAEAAPLREAPVRSVGHRLVQANVDDAIAIVAGELGLRA